MQMLLVSASLLNFTDLLAIYDTYLFLIKLIDFFTSAYTQAEPNKCVCDFAETIHEDILFKTMIAKS